MLLGLNYNQSKVECKRKYTDQEEEYINSCIYGSKTKAGYKGCRALNDCYCMHRNEKCYMNCNFYKNKKQYAINKDGYTYEKKRGD